MSKRVQLSLRFLTVYCIEKSLSASNNVQYWSIQGSINKIWKANSIILTRKINENQKIHIFNTFLSWNLIKLLKIMEIEWELFKEKLKINGN